MNSIDLRLLDLIQVAEAPVYSAYRWLSRQLGRQLSMPEFFRLLAGMVEDDVVRLWAVDVVTHERSRWNDVPDDLEERYAQIGELDDGFDPFGLSLTRTRGRSRGESRLGGRFRLRRPTVRGAGESSRRSERAAADQANVPRV